jgi:hypothetical protein
MKTPIKKNDITVQFVTGLTSSDEPYASLNAGLVIPDDEMFPRVIM